MPEFNCSCLLAALLSNHFTLLKHQVYFCIHIACHAEWEKGQNLPNFKDAAHNDIPDYVNHLGFQLWSAAMRNSALLWFMQSCFWKIFCPDLLAILILSSVSITLIIFSSRHHPMWMARLGPAGSFLYGNTLGTKSWIRVDQGRGQTNIDLIG